MITDDETGLHTLLAKAVFFIKLAVASTQGVTISLLLLYIGWPIPTWNRDSKVYHLENNRSEVLFLSIIICSS